MEIVIAFIRDLAFLLGRDMDNEDREGIVYEVVAEAEDGRRWVHRVDFIRDEMVWEQTEQDMFCYIKRDDTAIERAQRLADQVHAAGRINLDHWMPIEARYGSQSHDELALVAWEAKKDREEGYA